MLLNSLLPSLQLQLSLGVKTNKLKCDAPAHDAAAADDAAADDAATAADDAAADDAAAAAAVCSIGILSRHICAVSLGASRI